MATGMEEFEKQFREYVEKCPTVRVPLFEISVDPTYKPKPMKSPTGLINHLREYGERNRIINTLGTDPIAAYSMPMNVPQTKYVDMTSGEIERYIYGLFGK